MTAWRLWAMAVATVALMATCASAQDNYPSRPVRLVVGVAPGSTADISLRLLAQKLSQILGGQFVVENRTGAGTSLAAQTVVQSPKDGYTLMYGGSANTVNATLSPNLGFDLAKDLDPVARIAAVPNVLVVHPTLGVKTVAELIALAKSQPGQVLYASSGVGTSPHLSAELFKLMAGVNLMHVPYTGSSQAVNDVITGRVPVMFMPASTALPQVRAGAADRARQHPRQADGGAAGPADHVGIRARRLRNRRLERAARPRRHAAPDYRPAGAGRGRSGQLRGFHQGAGRQRHPAVRRHAGGTRTIHPQRDRKMGQGGDRGRNAEAVKEASMKFEGTSAYVATDDLKVAVNAAITLERPLLVKGEPGTGKTVLALEIAKSLNAPLIEWHVKSTTKALQGLYEYDAVSRLRDSQLGDERVRDIRNYIKRGKLWDAFVADERPVLLIDEIDKADIEFPNDLLLELDRMEFFVYETGETVKARRRPLMIITSNNEKELPDAFLRRCFFHYIRFPDADTMRAIIEVHFPGIKQRLVSEALKLFYEVREVPGLKKKPSTSELLDWLKLLMVEDIGPEILRERDPKKLIPPLHGALLKNEQDVHLFERLAFMARRDGR